MSFVFFMLTLSPLFSIPFFHAFSLVMHSSSVSAITGRSSAYSSSQGTSGQNSHESPSSTSIKSRGLKTEPWCMWTPTQNSSLYCPFTLTWLLAFVYMPCMILIAHFSIPTLLRARYCNFLGTLWKAFKARQSGLFAAKYFSWSWRLCPYQEQIQSACGLYLPSCGWRSLVLAQVTSSPGQWAWDHGSCLYLGPLLYLCRG